MRVAIILPLQRLGTAAPFGAISDLLYLLDLDKEA